MRDTFVAIDFETTGLSPSRGDAIVEIGAVKFGSDGSVFDEFSLLVNPGFAIPYAATCIHGISDRDVAGCPSPETAWGRFCGWAGDYRALVAHNAPFEQRFIAALQGKLTKEPVFLDTLQLARQTYRDLPNHKLGTLASYLGYVMTNAHRALPDARATAHLLTDIVRRSPALLDPYRPRVDTQVPQTILDIPRPHRTSSPGLARNPGTKSRSNALKAKTRVGAKKPLRNNYDQDLANLVCLLCATDPNRDEDLLGTYTKEFGDDYVDAVRAIVQRIEEGNFDQSDIGYTCFDGDDIALILKVIHAEKGLDVSGISLSTTETAARGEDDRRSKSVTRTTKACLPQPDGSTYEGDVLDGVPNGNGKQLWPDGSSYSGGFFRGKRTGKGEYRWTDGSTYVGAVVDGWFDGKGSLIRPNGLKYDGQFREGEMHGKGTLIAPDGSRYTGDFVAGSKSGKGVLRLADGTVDQGTFVEDHIVDGVRTTLDGVLYSGPYKDGAPNGRGQLVIPGQGVYFGDVVNGKCSGWGVIRRENGDRYVGEFRDGKRTGIGTLHPYIAPIVYGNPLPRITEKTPAGSTNRPHESAPRSAPVPSSTDAPVTSSKKPVSESLGQSGPVPPSTGTTGASKNSVTERTVQSRPATQDDPDDFVSDWPLVRFILFVIVVLAVASVLGI